MADITVTSDGGRNHSNQPVATAPRREREHRLWPPATDVPQPHGYRLGTRRVHPDGENRLRGLSGPWHGDGRPPRPT